MGSVESIVGEVVSAGFAVKSVLVEPRKNAEDQDNLVICAVKPCA